MNVHNIFVFDGKHGESISTNIEGSIDVTILLIRANQNSFLGGVRLAYWQFIVSHCPCSGELV